MVRVIALARAILAHQHGETFETKSSGAAAANHFVALLGVSLLRLEI